jgi:hypothetical protein
MSPHLAAAEKAILLTLDEYKRHELTEEQARSDLRVRFDGRSDDALSRALVKYLDDILSRVACDEISNDTAAADINQMIAAVTANDPSAEWLAQLNRD